jgi:5-methylcytosine-specific restriction protein A
MRLEEVYGPVADGYIEAHHLMLFASLEGRPTELDPKTDFAVVCANCHRMLHRGAPYTVQELRDMLSQVRSEPAT